MARKKLSFFEELKRRKIFQVVAGYALFAMGAGGVADSFFPAFNVPDWFTAAFLGIVLLGFFPAVIFAWIYDATPEGLVKTDDVAELGEQVEDRGPSKTEPTRMNPIWWVVAPLSIAAASAYFFNLGGIKDATRATLSTLLSSGLQVAELTYPLADGGAARDGSFTISFNAPINVASVTDGSVQLMGPDGSSVDAAVAVNSDQASVEIDPEADLEFDADYSVVIAATLTGVDGQGVVQDGQPGATLTFRTQSVPSDYPRPELVREVQGFDAQRARPRSPIPLQFSGPVNPASVTGESVQLFDNLGNTVAAAVTCCTNNRATVTPTAALERSARYAVRVSDDVVDPIGVAMRADSLVFQIADAPPPPPTGPGRLNFDVAPRTAREHVLVVLDGDTIGPPPITGRQLTQNQNHTIEVVGVHNISPYKLRVHRETVRPTPGQRLNINAPIQSFGWITIASTPGGLVFIDGQSVGGTPLAGYPVTAGAVHTIEVRPLPGNADQYDPWSAEFQIEDLESKALGRVTLPPKGES